MAAALNDGQRATIARLLTREAQDATSLWPRLKRAPKRPTTKRIRAPITPARGLQSLNRTSQAVEGIPETTWQRFADEARALDTSRMQAMQEATRVTLAVALIRVQTAHALDDLAELFIRRLQKRHQQANDALAEYRRQHQEQADTLIALLGQIVRDWHASTTPAQRLQAVDALIGTEADTIRAQCDTHLGYAGNHYLPFLVPLFTPHRTLLVDILAFLRPPSTRADTALEQAITVVLRHRDGRAPRLLIVGNDHGSDCALDVSWIPPRWWKAVTGRLRRDVPVVTGDRRDRELCVRSGAMLELKSGDLCVAGREPFSDYRPQLGRWEA